MGRLVDETEGAALDPVVRIAARGLNAPIALIAVSDGSSGAGHVLAAGVGLPPAWSRGDALDAALPSSAAALDAPLAIADVRGTPRLRKDRAVAALGAIACLVAPLHDPSGSSFGALCVLDQRPRAWSEEERDQLSDLAAIAAHEHLRSLVSRERRGLRNVAMAVAHGAKSEAIFALVAEEIAAAYGGEAGAVARYEDDRVARIVGTWSADGVQGLQLDGVLSLEGGGIAAGLRAGAPARADGGPGHRPFRWRVGAPIRSGSRVWGFVTALCSLRPFPVDVEHRLADFAELISAALVHEEARGQLAELATTDPLTGLANQRAFQQRLAAETERARRHGRNLGVALIDVDGFKVVNDTYGHQAGDELLRAVARRASGTVRAGELLARVGGDELALLLPEADAEEAYTAAERIRQLIAHEPIGPSGSITVSVGVSDLELGGDGEGMMRTADDALYWAKAHGRNVVAQFIPELREQLGLEQRAERVTRRQALMGIGALARAIDAKDPESERHSERVAELAVRLARAAGWPPERLALLREAALVHDVGKIGVPENVLVKQAHSPAEAAQLREHARLGADIASEVLTPEQVTWIRSHHERPDGRGYPDGLIGDTIPPGARLLAVADAWDAMTGPSSVRLPLSPEQALRQCRVGAGTQFSPEAVAALERVLAAGELAPAFIDPSAISLGA
ncbi:MAG TPA: diguanylate cyclase [Conexibacter sp.]|jgi:diguanylate cyclase (GGDEF)-like protein/putative nucleotidyltransferase with HDIG domain